MVDFEVTPEKLNPGTFLPDFVEIYKVLHLYTCIIGVPCIVRNASQRCLCMSIVKKPGSAMQYAGKPIIKITLAHLQAGIVLEPRLPKLIGSSLTQRSAQAWGNSSHLYTRHNRLWVNRSKQDEETFSLTHGSYSIPIQNYWIAWWIAEKALIYQFNDKLWKKNTKRPILLQHISCTIKCGAGMSQPNTSASRVMEKRQHHRWCHLAVSDPREDFFIAVVWARLVSIESLTSRS